MVVTVSITRLNTRLLQPCFMVVTTLNYNLVTTLLHPCNKVVISVWEAICKKVRWKVLVDHRPEHSTRGRDLWQDSESAQNM